jgi:hypothetical protein
MTIECAWCTGVLYVLSSLSQLIGTSILGQSPIAQSFMQSFPPQVSTASYPYSTPLGPLSPYGTSGQQGFAVSLFDQKKKLLKYWIWPA